MFYQFTFPPEVQGGFPFLQTINAGEGVLAILTGVSAFIFINSLFLLFGVYFIFFCLLFELVFNLFLRNFLLV